MAASLPEAAERLGLSVAMVRRYCSNGKLPAQKVGRIGPYANGMWSGLLPLPAGVDGRWLTSSKHFDRQVTNTLQMTLDFRRELFYKYLKQESYLLQSIQAA